MAVSAVDAYECGVWLPTVCVQCAQQVLGLLGVETMVSPRAGRLTFAVFDHLVEWVRVELRG